MQNCVKNRQDLAQQPAVGRTGLAVLEFAMVSPNLLLLLLGVAEFAQAIFVTETLTNAARQGSRMGAQSTVPSLEIGELVTQIVTQELGVAGNLVVVDVQYTALPVALTDDDMCRVEVSLAAAQVGLGFSRMLVGSRLQAHAAVRRSAAH